MDREQVYETIRNLFNLSKKEELLEDVSCVYRKRMSQSAGRMYLFQKYICFYSKFLGQEHKVVIPIIEIKYLKKAKALGLIQNAIKFYMADDKTYFFKRMMNRNQTFDLIWKLWNE